MRLAKGCARALLALIVVVVVLCSAFFLGYALLQVR
jgi:hypothetical protein